MRSVFINWFTYKVNFESPFDSFNNKSVRCYGTPLAEVMFNITSSECIT